MAVEQVTAEPAGEFALKGITAQQGTLYAPRDGGWIETMNIAPAECHMIKGIDNIGICTTDVAKSVAFYQRLGFCESYRNDRGMMIAAGAVQLFVFATRQSIPPLVGRELGLCSNPPGIDHISLAVADVNALYSTLRAAGVRFDGPPQDQSYGARMVGLMDPDGNNFYLLQKL